MSEGASANSLLPLTVPLDRVGAALAFKSLTFALHNNDAPWR